MDLSGNVNAKQDNKANVIATVVFIPLNSVSDRKEYFASAEGVIVGERVQAGENRIGVIPGVKDVVDQELITDLILVPFDSGLAEGHILEQVSGNLCTNKIRVEIHP